MNTYTKFCPNVFIAKCEAPHEKGDVIILQTKYGKEHECTVVNRISKKQFDGFYYYSIVRTDGFNVQEWSKKRAEKLQNASINSDNKSNAYWEASHEGRDFLSLGEPIKIGHHSEKRHRALIERNHNRMAKSVELSKQSDEYKERSKYWEEKASTINLSMPESLDYYEFELEAAKINHEILKNNPEKREHSFSLTYAKKKVNEMEEKLKLAKVLWA